MALPPPPRKLKHGNFTGLQYKDHLKLTGTERNTADISYLFPNGTCPPFTSRHFITTRGKIIPCEKINHRYKLGAIENNKVVINPEELAGFYNNYIQKLMPLCSTCYVQGCMQCMFLIDWKDEKPICPEYIGIDSLTNAVIEAENEYKDASSNCEGYWFYIEPFANIFHGAGRSMLYNALTGKNIIIKSPEIISILKRLDNNKESAVIKITKEEYSEPAVFEFIKELRNEFMADIIEAEKGSTPPFVPKNQITVNDSILKNNNWNYLRHTDKGHLFQHIKQVALYLDTKFEHLSKNGRKPVTVDTHQEKNGFSDISKIESLITDFPKLKIINIYTDDFSYYPKVIKAIDNFHNSNEADKKFLTFFNFSYTQLYDNKILEEKKRNILREIDYKNCFLKIAVSFPVDLQKFSEAFRFFKQLSIKKRFVFYIEETHHIKKTEELVSEFNIEGYELRTLFNGRNKELYKQFVFADEEDILKSPVSLKKIHARSEINSNYFGKIHILPDGSVGSDLSKPLTSNLYDDSVYKLIFNELTEGKGLWKLTRDKVEPCKDCIYRMLCPPISEHELAMGRYNLCHVQNGHKKIEKRNFEVS